MTLAILKPDHVGDLVLSSAAIRWALRRRPDAVLFVASANAAIARIMFPGSDIRTIDFPHLSKSNNGHAGYPDLRGFEHVMFLRSDNRITPSWANLRCRDFSFPMDSHDHHQTILDYGVAAAVLGPYDIDALHFGDALPELERKAHLAPRSIGLCVGSGFHANLWPGVHWLDLGRALIDRGMEVHVICGPAERAVGTALATALGLDAGRVIQGGADLPGFLDQVGALDRVVASDGGAAHLCSLRAPMVSIFGPSPFRRYAPFGGFNRLLTRDLSCSPCCQWASMLVNGCLSTECMSAITPDDVLNAMGPPYHVPHEGYVSTLRPGLALYEGVSHLSRAAKLRERETRPRSFMPGLMEARTDAGRFGPGAPSGGTPNGVSDTHLAAAPADRADAHDGSAGRRGRNKAPPPGAEAAAPDPQAGPGQPGSRGLPAGRDLALNPSDALNGTSPEAATAAVSKRGAGKAVPAAPKPVSPAAKRPGRRPRA